MYGYIPVTDPDLVAKVRRSNVLNIVANVLAVPAGMGFLALVYTAWTAGPRWQVATAAAVFVVFSAVSGWAFDTCERWLCEAHWAAAQRTTDTYPRQIRPPDPARGTATCGLRNRWLCPATPLEWRQ